MFSVLKINEASSTTGLLKLQYSSYIQISPFSGFDNDHVYLSLTKQSTEQEVPYPNQ